MTKNELDYLDSALVGPAMLFLNQYFNFFFDEYYVLWSCMVSGNFTSFKPDDLSLYDNDVTTQSNCLFLLVQFSCLKTTQSEK